MGERADQFRVAFDEVGGAEVSTVDILGLMEEGYRLMNREPPDWLAPTQGYRFETMVFAPSGESVASTRVWTLEAALAAHRQAVNELKAAQPQ